MLDDPDLALLILDATTGQNALSQVEIFRKTADITGLIVTKLDGTAKGGIVVAVQRELGVPVKLGSKGVEQIIVLPLNEAEREALDRSADSVRPGIFCFVFAELLDFVYAERLVRKSPHKSATQITRYTKIVPKLTKEDPRRDQHQSKRAPSSPKGVPKSIKMSFGTPLRHRARPRRKKDPPPRN